MNTNTNGLPAPDMIPGWSQFPHWLQLAIVLVFGLGPILGRAVHGLRFGGGIKGMVYGIWFGTNTPAPGQNETTKG